MPTYQYRCTSCSHDLEAFQHFTDAPLTTCPECGGTLRKVFSPVGVVFKGSGFYATDSRSKSKANAAKPGETHKADKSDARAASSSSDASSSSTTSTATESKAAS
ncbi:FmdB family zinc ribbon protein [Nigerium massiliense]|uniref:FmdB family zinc ribbon protein n=1 Tax=Nigerium massiliense TaxID=1522317 RepID=UPI00058C4427|nr:FmdB family zinc ribbon protein [Nigerium massiliense]